MSSEIVTDHPFGYVKGDKVFRKAFLDQPELEIGVVRETPEKSIEYFENRFKNLEAKIAKLQEDITEATNKGSFLMKLIHLKDKLMSHNGLGDYEALLKKMADVQKDLEESISQNRVRNKELKESFMNELKEFMKCTDDELRDIAEKVKENRNKWVRTGSIGDKEGETIEKEYADLLDAFFQRKKAFVEKQKEEVKKITIHYNNMLYEMGRLRSQKDKEMVKQKILEYKESWAKLPPLPERVKVAFDRKWEKKVKDILEFRPRNQFNKPRQFQQNRGYQQNRGFGSREHASPEMIQQKEELLNQAISLIKLDLDDAVNQAKSLQEKWLNSGKSSSPEVRTIYNRFREIIASIFERKTLDLNLTKKYSDFGAKSQEEQKILKISIMRDLIRKAKTDLKLFEENLDMDPNDPVKTGDRALLTKVKNQKFRIKIRENLLRDIEMN